MISLQILNPCSLASEGRWPPADPVAVAALRGRRLESDVDDARPARDDHAQPRRPVGPEGAVAVPVQHRSARRELLHAAQAPTPQGPDPADCARQRRPHIRRLFVRVAVKPSAVCR